MIAVLHLPSACAQMQYRREQDFRSQPLLISGTHRDAPRIVGVSPEAAAAGVAPGMTLRQARLRCPAATERFADTGAYAAGIEALLALLAEHSDRVVSLTLPWRDSEALRGALEVAIDLDACASVHAQQVARELGQPALLRRRGQ